MKYSEVIKEVGASAIHFPIEECDLAINPSEPQKLREGAYAFFSGEKEIDGFRFVKEISGGFLYYHYANIEKSEHEIPGEG